MEEDHIAIPFSKMDFTNLDLDALLKEIAIEMQNGKTVKSISKYSDKGEYGIAVIFNSPLEVAMSNLLIHA